jgi:putative membrane protein
MMLLAIVLTILVAGLHIYFLILEMFLWTTPFGLKTFKMTPNQADATKVLAANQGLYNGFLAAGLLFSLFLGSPGVIVQGFFLLCVVIAGIYGAATVNRRIFFIQSLPALLALLTLIFSR